MERANDGKTKRQKSKKSGMNEEVLAALAKAKWNEFVRVDIESGNSSSSNDDAESSRSMILVPRLDRQNGGVKWEDSRQEQQSSDSHGNAETTAHIHTKKWIFPMLNDQRRNDLYERAIERASKEAVRRFQSANEHPKSEGTAVSSSTVTLSTLDIGSGTGLLAMLSEKHLLKALDPTNAPTSGDVALQAPPTCNIEVTSLEMAGPMADLAKRTIELEKQKQGKINNLPTIPSTVNIVEGHSCKIPPMKQSGEQAIEEKNHSSATATAAPETKGGAWLCTSELLESGLLGEGWLPAMRDAWERHLHPQAVVVPQRARVVAQLVEGAACFGGPHRQLPIPTTNSDSATKLPPLNLFTSAPSQDEASDIGTLSDGSYDPFTGQKHGIQVEIHADRYLSGEEPVLRVLSEPIVALSVDATSSQSLSNPQTEGISPTYNRLVATASGTAQGILFWWELDLYGDDLTYSTRPGSDFQDHWHQCLYVFPHTTKGRTIQSGTEYILSAHHTDSRVHFSISDTTPPNSQSGRESKKPKPRVPPQVPPVVSPFRCWQLNDLHRSATLRDGIAYALQSTSATPAATSNVLDLSDFSLCGMMACLLGAHHVTSVESSSSGLTMASAKVAQIRNGLSSDSNFQMVQCHAESLTQEITSGIVDLVVGEPYYEMLEGWPIETALNHFYTLRMLKAKGVVQPNAQSVPARAIILACGVECADLRTAYRHDLAADPPSTTSSNGETNRKAHVCGFDHTPVADCWNYDRHGISIPLWEYNNVEAVTEIVEVGMLDYETNRILQGNWVSQDNEPSSFLLAPFTQANRTCHAIAFWVDYGIRKASNENTSTNDDSSFEILSTGFGKVAERQTVRILAQEEPAILGKSLKIPRHGLEL